ncbi:MAG: hypothetical protein LC768_08875, partial [Acidobacteria bacterium]|nr:hypothetical protein [Acidobacteriota bacterium]MCA1638431.1 hypothetical protein [Acidobacteriota bacterium]
MILFLHPSVSAQRLSAKNDINLVESSVKYAGAEAISDGRGVLIEWETVNESENLGFYIYRIDGNQKVLVNPSLIPGAHLQVREGQTFGKKYTFFDIEGDLSSTYYIESLNLNGQTQVSNQFSSKFISDFSSPVGKLFEAGRKSFTTANPNVLKNEVSLPKTLQAEVEENKLQADSDKQRWVAAQPGVKIGVKKEGIYRVTKTELQTAGFDVTASTAFWQLYRDGVEQSIIVGNNGDYIEFYGKGIDTRESDTQIYFLVVGTENGKRINSTFRRAIGSPVLQDSYAQSFIFKERTQYISTIFNGETDNFFGRVISNTTVTITLNLSAVDFNAAVSSIDITIQGSTETGHQTKVILNGVELGVITGSGKNSMSRRFEIQTSILKEGTNDLQLTTLNGASDISLFDTVKVNYARRLQAVQNSLSFYTKNYKAINLGGFSSPNIRVFDISYPDSPSIVANPQIKQNGSNYQLYLPPYRGRVM